jgi:hypothetical protein
MTMKLRLAAWRRRATIALSLAALLSNSFSAFGENRRNDEADRIKTAPPI